MPRTLSVYLDLNQACDDQRPNYSPRDEARRVVANLAKLPSPA